MQFERWGLSRRDYLRTAVAVGGAASLAACVEPGGTSIPAGTDDPDSLPRRQHAWNAGLESDADGNVRPPEHHLLVALDLTFEGEPDADAREIVETVFRTLERAYEWSTDGLVFTVAYTPAYFDRFDADGLAGVDLPEPEPLTPREDLDVDDADLLVHLASDRAAVVLAVEEALSGDRDELNGVELPVDPTTVLSVRDDDRRTGFVGPGLPADHADERAVPDSIPDEAPFFMGFRSGFRESQATEDRVTIEAGPFAGGTTQHVSSMEIQLETWYEQETHYQRVAKTFSPEHAEDELVGEVGERLSTSTGVAGDRADAVADHAAEYGMVGHAQKAARAREDGEPILLRRDVNTIDGGGPGLHFVSLQRELDDFVRVRLAMNGTDLAGNGVGETLNNGLLQYLFVERRGNFLVPPRPHRALPVPDPAPDPDAEGGADGESGAGEDGGTGSDSDGESATRAGIAPGEAGAAGTASVDQDITATDGETT